jgi:hypothetical protein
VPGLYKDRTFPLQILSNRPSINMAAVLAGSTGLVVLFS